MTTYCAARSHTLTRSPKHGSKAQTALSKIAFRRGDLHLAATEGDHAIATANALGNDSRLAIALRARALPAVFSGDFGAGKLSINAPWHLPRGPERRPSQQPLSLTSATLL